MSLPQDQVFNLLHIADLAKQWPSLRGIHDRAMKDLTKISQSMAEELAKEKVEEEKALAAKNAEPEAKIRTQAQADEKAEEERLKRARVQAESAAAAPRLQGEPVSVAGPLDQPVSNLGEEPVIERRL